LGDTLSILGVDLVQDFDLTFLNVSIGILEMSSHIGDQVIAILIGHDLSEQCLRLCEVAVRVVGFVSRSQSSHLEGSLSEFLSGSGSSEAVRLVVGFGALVSVDIHETITMVIIWSGSEWAIDWDLVIVNSKSMSVGVRVGEKTSLKHSVSRGFNSWDQMSRAESRLLNFSEVVFWVLVQNHFPEGDQWIIAMWPHLGHVEDVPFVVGAFAFGHDLDVKLPACGFAGCDAIE